MIQYLIAICTALCMWVTSALAAPPGWDDYAFWQAERLPQAGSVELVYCGIGNKSLAIVGYDYRTRASYKSFLDELYGVTSELEFFEGLIGEARDDQHRSDRYINDLADDYVTDAFLEGMLDYPDACVAVRKLDGGGYEVEYELPNNRRMNLHPSNTAYLDRSREQGMIIRSHHKVYTINADGRLVSSATMVDGRRINEDTYSYWKDAPPGFSIADHYGREGSGWVLVGARVSLEGEPKRFTEGRIRELAARIVRPGGVSS